MYSIPRVILWCLWGGGLRQRRGNQLSQLGVVRVGLLQFQRQQLPFEMGADLAEAPRQALVDQLVEGAGGGGQGRRGGDAVVWRRCRGGLCLGALWIVDLGDVADDVLQQWDCVVVQCCRPLVVERYVEIRGLREVVFAAHWPAPI